MAYRTLLNQWGHYTFLTLDGSIFSFVLNHFPELCLGSSRWTTKRFSYVMDNLQVIKRRLSKFYARCGPGFLLEQHLHSDWAADVLVKCIAVGQMRSDFLPKHLVLLTAHAWITERLLDHTVFVVPDVSWSRRAVTYVRAQVMPPNKCQDEDRQGTHPQLVQLKWSGWYGSFLKMSGWSSIMAWHFWQMYLPRPRAFSRLWHGRHRCLWKQIVASQGLTYHEHSQ